MNSSIQKTLAIKKRIRCDFAENHVMQGFRELGQHIRTYDTICFPNIFFMIGMFFFICTRACLADEFKPMDDSVCTPIRLDKPSSPLSKIPRHNMGGFVMCTAYSTTYLVDAERLRQNPDTKHFTSPFAIGIQHKYRRRLNDPSLEDKLIVRDNILIPQNIHSYYSCSYQVVGDVWATMVDGSPLASALYKRYKNSNADEIVSILNRGGIYSLQLEDVKAALNQGTWMGFMAMLIDALCRGSKIELRDLPDMNIIRSKNFGPRRTEALNTFRSTINLNLELGKPTGVNYCQLVLGNMSVTGINAHTGYFDANTCSVGDKGDTEIAGHSGNVVGRRLLTYKKNGESKTVCQYLIRDTWGSSCAKYPPDFNVTPPETCENGSIWVDEDAILFNTSEIFYFGSKS